MRGTRLRRDGDDLSAGDRPVPPATVPTLITIKACDRLAEATAEHLSPDRGAAVQGRLAHEEWTGFDGRRAERLTVVADASIFWDVPPARGDLTRRQDQAVEKGNDGRRRGNRPLSRNMAAESHPPQFPEAL